MRSTFWPNRDFERESSQNRHTGLKFSSKPESSALSLKIVQNALFRSCAARFGQFAILSVKVLKIVTVAWNCLWNRKAVRFAWKLYKTLFSGHAQHVLAKSHLWASKFSKSWNWPQTCSKRENSALFIKIVQNALFRSCAARFVQIAFWASKFSKSSHWPEILSKKGKPCAFDKNCTKRSFQVMRSTFWPNRDFERESSQNRHTGLKFSSKPESSALSLKIVQNALFRSCAARFGQFAILSVKVLKIVTVAWNCLWNRKAVRFAWKLYKTLFSGHAQHVLAKSHLWASKFSKSWNWPQTCSKRENSALFIKIVQNALFRSCAARFGQIAFWASKFSKSSHWPEILFETRKQCAFHQNCTKRSFQVMRSTFWPNRISEHESSQNRHTGLKFSSKRVNSALLIKIVQNALFRSCAARFGQIAILSVKVLKIVTLAWNSLRNRKAVRFPWKLYKTLFSGHAQHVLANSQFWALKFSKSSHWPEILFETGKQCAFLENCTKRSFQVMRSTFWPIRNFER